MTARHRYTLEKGSKKHHCPKCEKKRFVRYIDTQECNYIPARYGRCDREVNCGYHLNPYNDGFSKANWTASELLNSISKVGHRKHRKSPRNKPKRTFIPTDVLRQTCDGYEKNTFIQNLLTNVAFPFEVRDVEAVIGLYHLGTVSFGYRAGAITLPFIDIKNRIRAIQVKQFDENNHTVGTDFLHSIIEKYHARNNMSQPEWIEAYKQNETKVSCLFGEHLLTKYPHNPIGLVEAPKTAIYGTLYFGGPDQPKNLLWLAVYNLSSLNLNKCKALSGRSVFLFPDLSKNGKAYDLWRKKATEIQKQLPGTFLQVSDLLERLAPGLDKAKGKDLADYLITMDWRAFRKREMGAEASKLTSSDVSLASVKSEKSERPKTSVFPPPTSEPKLRSTCSVETEKNIIINAPDNWNPQITELEQFFKEVQLTDQTVRLNRSSTIINCRLFVRNHLKTIKRNNGIRTFLPYLHRLQELRRTLAPMNTEPHDCAIKERQKSPSLRSGNRPNGRKIIK